MKRPALKKILYVDDEPDIREVVELSLGLAESLTVVTCDSGARALEVIQKFAPDLVILDVMMPGMDGPTTLQHMRSRPELEKFPVIFMTAKAMSQEIARFLALGAVGVIAKPFDPMTLVEQIYQIWESLPDD